MCKDYVYHKPEEVINGYIKACLNGDYLIIAMYDDTTTKNANARFRAAPKSIANQERKKAISESVESIEFKINQHKNDPWSANLDNPDHMVIVMETLPLFYIIFPNTKYKILEIRNENNLKTVFLQLIYSDINNAPFDKTGQKLKKAIVKVIMNKWTYPDYTSYEIIGYIPTEYKREYFTN
jgi:hypothetical protein